jgi:hypothetical protein
MIGFALKAHGLLKRVPWPVYAALALLAVWAWDRISYGNRRYDAGRAAVVAELKQAQAKVMKRAAAAIAAADDAGAKRAEVETKVLSGQIKKIEQAEAKNENPLDALF